MLLSAPGEDPLLTSLYARHFVQGLQQPPRNGSSTTTTNTGDTKLQVAACCKHFVANSLENWMGHTRHNFDARISEADLNDYYFRPFQECVQAGAAGVMCSYNAVNGVPSCISDNLLKKTLRETWGFDGYLVTDCGALADTISGHGAAKDAVESSAKAKRATVDLNCGDVFQQGLLQAYQEGFVVESAISDSFRRLATIQFRLGLFDVKEYQPEQALHMVGSHGSLALEAALQSIVLLKNQEGILPLEPDHKIAMIGPHVFGREVFLSNYNGDVCLKNDSQDSMYACIQSPVEAFSKLADHPINARLGCHVADTDLNEIDKAVESAKNADRVVLLVGLDQTQEREEKDRTETILPGLQQELIHAILGVASEKTIIVLIHGGAISLGDDTIAKAPAILSASYGGQMASQALAQVLFGAYNPTGKLAATMYRPSYVNDIPLTEMGLNVGVGRTHMYFSGSPEFAFGYGLSYSNWEIEWNDQARFGLDATTHSSMKVGIKITNLGPMEGSQTVLLFWSPTENGRVRQKLAGFQGTSLLAAGESEGLEFQIDYETFAMWQEDIGSSITEAGTYQLEARASNVSTTNFILVAATEEATSR
jgi:beta-D-xylosidase 4